MKKKILAVAAIAIGLASPAVSISTSQPVQAATQSEKTAMRTFVRNVMDQNNVRGSAVIIKDGEPQQISLGYGWYGKKIGNGNPKVVYPTASLQKVLTAAMIIQLINETSGTNQQFTQYTKISRWFPTLRNANKIAVGNLLTHTSGIWATGSEVNRGYNYSEANAINWIIRAVTGKSYEENFQERIVNKLGLQHTYLYQNIPSSMTDAISYNWNNGSYRNAAYVKRSLASQLPGAGNLFSTPMDYYKMQVGLTDGSILSASDFNYLTHLKSKKTDYSGGVYLKNNDSLKMAYGNLAGTHFGNWFQMTTDNKNGLILFLNQTNDNESTVKSIGYQILNYIQPNTFSAN